MGESAFRATWQMLPQMPVKTKMGSTQRAPSNSEAIAAKIQRKSMFPERWPKSPCSRVALRSVNISSHAPLLKSPERIPCQAETISSGTAEKRSVKV